ncbi:hypothetical protein Apa02nite_085220 [Actinoplanes palleronii]|uniref:Uncharacterized protein n=1 Tax=Actinoplanes palleronii TaxID=113570 RepID=A0ABQ4BP11_9ACTN|nr:hypothetical protein Apa02nite_085220 [Actinoplanes palleronii]
MLAQQTAAIATTHRQRQLIQRTPIHLANAGSHGNYGRCGERSQHARSLDERGQRRLMRTIFPSAHRLTR